MHMIVCFGPHSGTPVLYHKTFLGLRAGNLHCPLGFEVYGLRVRAMRVKTCV